MKLETGNFCPLIGKDCIQLQCAWFTKIRGMNPQSGEEVDEWGCAVKWMPLLTIENSQQQRQTGAAIESFRNESVKSTEISNKLFAAAIQQRQNLLDQK